MADLKIDSELKEQINVFTKAYKVLKPDKEKLTEDLAARGWFFNHSTLPGFWVTVLYHVKKGDFETLDQIFCDLYEVVYIPIEKCTNIQLKSVPVSKD